MIIIKTKKFSTKNSPDSGAVKMQKRRKESATANQKKRKMKSAKCLKVYGYQEKNT